MTIRPFVPVPQIAKPLNLFANLKAWAWPLDETFDETERAIAVDYAVKNQITDASSVTALKNVTPVSEVTASFVKNTAFDSRNFMIGKLSDDSTVTRPLNLQNLEWFAAESAFINSVRISTDKIPEGSSWRLRSLHARIIRAENYNGWTTSHNAEQRWFRLSIVLEDVEKGTEVRHKGQKIYFNTSSWDDRYEVSVSLSDQESFLINDKFKIHVELETAFPGLKNWGSNSTLSAPTGTVNVKKASPSSSFTSDKTFWSTKPSENFDAKENVVWFVRGAGSSNVPKIYAGDTGILPRDLLLESGETVNLSGFAGGTVVRSPVNPVDYAPELDSSDKVYWEAILKASPKRVEIEADAAICLERVG